MAACTIPVVIADPAANTVAEQVRACHDEGVGVAVFPELCLTGYAIDDLLSPGSVCTSRCVRTCGVPVSPSAEAALAGARCWPTCPGSPITVGKSRTRHLLCRATSLRCLAAYVFAAAGEGESTTDLSWDGQTMIYEAGELLVQTERFHSGAGSCSAPVTCRNWRSGGAPTGWGTRCRITP